jgi:hypothetical protein
MTSVADILTVEAATVIQTAIDDFCGWPEGALDVTQVDHSILLVDLNEQVLLLSAGTGWKATQAYREPELAATQAEALRALFAHDYAMQAEA